MRKFLPIIFFLLALVCSFGENPTQVRGTNGIKNVPSTTYAGRVSLGLQTNARAAGFVYSSVDGGPVNFQWIAPSTTSPGGASGDIQYNNSSSFGGSNAWRIIFSAQDAIQTNAAGGDLLLSTTNFSLINSTRVGFGKITHAQLSTGSTLDFKFYSPQTSSSIYHQTSSGFPNCEQYLDSSGYAQIILTHSGSVNGQLYFGGNADKRIETYANSGPAILSCPTNYYVAMGFESAGPASTFTPYVQATNNGVNIFKSVNGNGNAITNFSNLYPKFFAWCPFENIVVAGNAMTYGQVLAVPEAIQYYQNPPAVNDQTRIDGILAANTNYTLHVLGHTANSRGIETWKIVDYLSNTNNIGTIDWYDAVGANGLVKTLGPFTLTNGGAVRILKVMATKNGSSSDYYDTTVKCWIDSGN